MKTSNFITTEFIDSIKIHPKYVGKNILDILLKELRQKKEGICSEHGYIKKNSIEIIKCNNGKIEKSTFHGYVNFLVKYRADVCNPVPGNIVEAKIKKINKFGILCVESSATDENQSILEIIVPKHSSSIQSEIDLNEISQGQIVRVEIVGKKYQLNHDSISIIGKIVPNNNLSIGGSQLSLDKNFNSDNLITEDDDDIDILINDDEDEDEDEDDDNDNKNNDIDISDDEKHKVDDDIESESDEDDDIDNEDDFVSDSDDE